MWGGARRDVWVTVLPGTASVAPSRHRGYTPAAPALAITVARRSAAGASWERFLSHSWKDCMRYRGEAVRGFLMQVWENAAASRCGGRSAVAAVLTRGSGP
jgi:hypothetical protein